MTRSLRVHSFEIHGYSLPYARPVHWFDSTETEGHYVMLRLRAIDGQVGIAEAPVRPSWSGVSMRSLVAALEDLLLPALRTVDIADEEAVSRAIQRFPENSLAKMLVDNACWALRAEAAGKPLWRLWGGQARVPLSWCVTRQEPTRMAEEAALMVQRHGFHALKIKGGQGLKQDLDAVQRVRDAVGNQVSLSVDANCAYAPGEALQYVRALADAGVALVEDPCPLSPEPSFTELVSAAPLPLLVDTACASLRDARDFLDRGARALSIKAGRIGFTEARRIEGLIRTRNAAAAAGLYAESALGTWMSLQFASALTSPVTPAEMSFFLMLEEQVLAQPLSISDGHVELTEAPGVDGQVDWSLVRNRTLLAS